MSRWKRRDLAVEQVREAFGLERAEILNVWQAEISRWGLGSPYLLLQG